MSLHLPITEAMGISAGRSLLTLSSFAMAHCSSDGDILDDIFSFGASGVLPLDGVLFRAGSLVDDVCAVAGEGDVLCEGDAVVFGVGMYNGIRS